MEEGLTVTFIRVQATAMDDCSSEHEEEGEAGRRAGHFDGQLMDAIRRMLAGAELSYPSCQKIQPMTTPRKSGNVPGCD